MAPSPPPDGLYAPLPAFFDSMDELDLESYAQHTKYVSAAGVIPVVSATIGEAVHLDRNERIRLIRTARSVLDENNLRETPVVAGVGATSTRETIALAEDAAAAGASFVLVAAPGYYAGVLRSSPTAVKDFFVDVASRSPLPLIIYNYPVIAGGIDLSSNDIVEIAKAAPNVRGAMLSCGNVGKVSRITSQLDESFKTFAGFIDFLLPSVVVGSAGAISPIPNVVPNLAMELWRSTQTLEGKADYGKARRLQETASLAEAELLSGGIPGIKHLLGQRFGYPAAPRRPLPSVSEAVAVRLSKSEYLKDV